MKETQEIITEPPGGLAGNLVRNELCLAASWPKLLLLNPARVTSCRLAGFQLNPVFRWLLLVLLALPLAGCLSRPSLVRQSFVFSPGPQSRRPQAAGDLDLQIRRLNIAAPFDNQSFIYRTGEYTYETDPYAQFLAPPQDCLLKAVRTDWRRDGVFRDVVEPGSALKPNIIAEITVSQLYGDFRHLAAPAAVLGMRFVFFAVQQDSEPGKVLLQAHYEKRIPVRHRTADAVMAGWNQGLEEILATVAKDLKSAKPAARGAKPNS